MAPVVVPKSVTVSDTIRTDAAVVSAVLDAEVVPTTTAPDVEPPVLSSVVGEFSVL